MNYPRAVWSSLGMFFMAGAILLIFLTLLGGVTNSNPLNIIWFVQARTDNIPGAPAVSRWTFWSLCSVEDDGKSYCPNTHVEHPIDPPSHQNFDTTINVPKDFIGTRHYFLTSRFMFPFLVIGLFFEVSSFLIGIAATMTRVGSYLCAILACTALVFQILCTTLMTAVSVQTRNKFNKNGQSARIGTKAFAFMWTATACIVLSCVAYCYGGSATGYAGPYYTDGITYTTVNARDGKRRGDFLARELESSPRGISNTHVTTKTLYG